MGFSSGLHVEFTNYSLRFQRASVPENTYHCGTVIHSSYSGKEFGTYQTGSSRVATREPRDIESVAILDFRRHGQAELHESVLCQCEGTSQVRQYGSKTCDRNKYRRRCK